MTNQDPGQQVLVHLKDGSILEGVVLDYYSASGDFLFALRGDRGGPERARILLNERNVLSGTAERAGLPVVSAPQRKATKPPDHKRILQENLEILHQRFATAARSFGSIHPPEELVHAVIHYRTGKIVDIEEEGDAPRNTPGRDMWGWVRPNYCYIEIRVDLETGEKDILFPFDSVNGNAVTLSPHAKRAVEKAVNEYVRRRMAKGER